LKRKQLIVVGFIVIVIAFLSLFIFFTDDLEPIYLTSANQLIGVMGFEPVILHSSLVVAGYYHSVTNTDLITSHFYIAVLEDSYIFVKVDFTTQRWTLLRPNDIENAIIEGAIRRYNQSTYFRRLRNSLMNDWGFTYDEFNEMFTRYFVLVRPSGITVINPE